MRLALIWFVIEVFQLCYPDQYGDRKVGYNETQDNRDNYILHTGGCGAKILISAICVSKNFKTQRIMPSREKIVQYAENLGNFLLLLRLIKRQLSCQN